MVQLEYQRKWKICLPQRGGLKFPLQLQVKLFLSSLGWHVALFWQGLGMHGFTVSVKINRGYNTVARRHEFYFRVAKQNHCASGWLDRYIMIWRIMQILEAGIHLGLVILLPNLHLQCNNWLLTVIKTEVSSNSTYCLHSQGVDNPLDRYNERNPRLWRMCHHSCKDWVCSDQMVLQLDRVRERREK